MRLAGAIAVLAALPVLALPMPSYDVQGLMMVSEAVVVAERLGTADAGAGRGLYRVTRVVKGDVPATLELFDDLYATSWNPGATRVVLFLYKAGELHDRWAPVSSGLMQERGGQLIRFEQRANPGGFVPVEDGRPVTLDDVLNEAKAALRRVGQPEALASETDVVRRRAAARALLVERIEAARLPFFFEDVWAQRVLSALVTAGDFEGALELKHFDRTRPAGLASTFAVPLEALLTIALTPSRPPALRAQALVSSLDAMRLVDEPNLVPRLKPLVDDEAPEVRAAAAKVLARTLFWSSSDATENRRLKGQAAAARQVLAARFAVEEDARPLYALAEPSTERTLPTRRGTLPFGAEVRIEAARLSVFVICVARLRLEQVRLVTGGLPLPAAVHTLRCGDNVTSGVDDPRPNLAPGRYPLFLEGKTMSKVTQWPVGALLVESNGGWTLE